MTKELISRSVWAGIEEQAQWVMDSAIQNVSSWLSVDIGTAQEVLRGQWAITYPLFRKHATAAAAMVSDALGESLANPVLPDISSEAKSALDKLKLYGTRNQQIGMEYAALGWGIAQATQHVVTRRASIAAPTLLAGAASHLGIACGYFGVAQMASKAARKKAGKKAQKSSEKRAEIEKMLPGLMDEHIVNAGYKSADQIARELRGKDFISLDRKELRKMVAAVKRSRA